MRNESTDSPCSCIQKSQECRRSRIVSIPLVLKDLSWPRRVEPRCTVLRQKAYAVRDEEGKFEDIQSYQRAHAQDMKRESKAEKAQKEAKGAEVPASLHRQPKKGSRETSR